MVKLKDLKNIDRNDFLHLVGLQTRPRASDWILPAAGFFGAGILIGTGIGMLIAPKPGRELMGDLRQKMNGAKDELAQKMPQITAPPMPAQRS